jgi:hypothetical protein
MGTRRAKPSRVELLTSSIHGTAMTSIRYLPQNYFSRVVVVNPFGLLTECCHLPIRVSEESARGFEGDSDSGSRPDYRSLLCMRPKWAQIVSTFVSKASPANSRLAIERSAASQ